MEELFKTIKTFLSGWGSFVLGIGVTAILLYVLYLMIRAILF